MATITECRWKEPMSGSKSLEVRASEEETEEQSVSQSPETGRKHTGTGSGAEWRAGGAGASLEGLLFVSCPFPHVGYPSPPLFPFFPFHSPPLSSFFSSVKPGTFLFPGKERKPNLGHFISEIQQNRSILKKAQASLR